MSTHSGIAFQRTPLGHAYGLQVPGFGLYGLQNMLPFNPGQIQGKIRF